MRVLLLGVVAAVSAHFTSVTYVHYEDANCKKSVATVTRPVGSCIKEMREGHYRLLSCSEGVVSDTEYSDSECREPILTGEHHTNVCHEGAGHSLKMTCGDATSFTSIKPTWADVKSVALNSVNTSASCPGVCQDTSVACGASYIAGLCPGAANIQCCTSVKCVSRTDVINRLVSKANGQYCECVCPHLSPWRCDCSGIASYAWELAAPGQVTQTLPKYSARLAAWTDMKPGDIILKPDQHVEVFRNWETGTSVFGYCGCHNTADGCSCRTGSTASYWQGAGYYPAKGNMVC